jgi:DNA-binding response OmpR family regulator
MEMGKVLIVDDNQDLAHALEVRLHANGYQVFLAKDGTSAVSLALAHDPLAVLLDLHLPKEDGLAVMQELHSLPGLSSLPVIVVSADCSPVTRDKLLDAGAHSFLEKPVNHRALLHTLNDMRVRSQNWDRKLMEHSEPSQN